MGNKTLFLLSVTVTLSFTALIVFYLSSPALPLRLVIAAMVATGSVAVAYKRFMHRSNG